MKVCKWTTIVVKMRLFKIAVKTWTSLNSDISLYQQQRAGAQVCFHLTPGCGIMFRSDSSASQEAQRTQEWHGENLCQFRTEWLKKCLSFRSGILASCAAHFDNERWRAQLSPCHRLSHIDLFLWFSLPWVCLPALYSYNHNQNKHKRCYLIFSVSIAIFRL